MFRDYHMRFRRVVLLTPSVPMLCLKDLQKEDNTIYAGTSDGQGDQLEQDAWVLAT